jgi:hypothetical protein
MSLHFPLFPVHIQVTLVAEMTSSLKAWGTFLALLWLQCRLLVHGNDIPRREFMAKHHLNPSQEFHAYKCDVLMRERALEHQTSHLFLYTLWYKIEQICVSGNWKNWFKNTYIWAQGPIRVLKCHRESFANSYRESRSYSYVQFHCSMGGYVDSIEDIKIIEPLFY